MSGTHTIEQQKMFERLAGALSLHGWKDFEVTFESDELTIEKHGGNAACTVIKLPGEPAFQAHFAFPSLSVSAISFTIGEKPANETVPAATMRFTDVDEATGWLLNFLQTAGRPDVLR